MPRTAVITGGTGGIGQAIVSRFADDGMNVIFTYNSDLEGARKIEHRFSGGEVKGFKCDLSSPEEIGEFTEMILGSYDSVDVLVNNAGRSRDRLLLRTTMEDWKEVMKVNLDGAFAITRGFLRSMIRKRWGRIIFVSSVAGLRGNVGQASYASSKAALIGLAKSIAREVASRNITSNVIAPGLIDTGMTRRMKDEFLLKLKELIPLGRTGTPEEVASLASYIAGDEASYITGQVFVVDGGLSI